MLTGNWAGKTVIVTGGAGFIGSHFIEELLARQVNVVCLYRRDNRGALGQLPVTDRLHLVKIDLLDYDAMRALFQEVTPGIDAIFHCAVVSGSMKFRYDHSAQILDTNMKMTSNILNCARSHDVPEVVLLSSSDIYLAPSVGPIREDDDFKKQMYYSPDGYYLSKSYEEILAEAHRSEFGMNIFSPRLTSVYGPRDNFEVDTDRVVPSMLAKVVAGQEIEIWGDGRQTRTYIYVTDLVQAIFQMVEKNKYQTLNVGTTETVSVLELAQLVCAAFGQPERIRFNLERSGGRQSRTLDVGKLYGIIDFEPRSMRDGLNKTVEWYRRYRGPLARAL